MSCSWCPSGCRSCTENRDCECYTHQDAPDRDVPRELSLRLDDGTIVRDAGWLCVADVLKSMRGFVPSGGRAYGVIVDAETLVQVHPPIKTGGG
jgi:hypothetical protein